MTETQRMSVEAATTPEAELEAIIAKLNQEGPEILRADLPADPVRAKAYLVRVAELCDQFNRDMWLAKQEA